MRQETVIKRSTNTKKGFQLTQDSRKDKKERFYAVSPSGFKSSLPTGSFNLSLKNSLLETVALAPGDMAKVGKCLTINKI